MSANHATEITVLIADDDDGHAMLIQEHLEDAGIHNSITRFRDGAEAWAFLSGEGLPAGQAKRDPEQAYMLLLDIRMPRMDGVEVLRRIKAHPELHSLPVIMLLVGVMPASSNSMRRRACSMAVLSQPAAFAVS